MQRPGDGRACYRVADLTAAVVANLAEAVVTPAAGRVVLHNGAGVLDASGEVDSRRVQDARSCDREGRIGARSTSAASAVSELPYPVISPTLHVKPGVDRAGMAIARCEGESRKRSVRGVRHYRHRGKTKTADLTVTELTGPAITPTHRRHPRGERWRKCEAGRRRRWAAGQRRLWPASDLRPWWARAPTY